MSGAGPDGWVVASVRFVRPDAPLEKRLNAVRYWNALYGWKRPLHMAKVFGTKTEAETAMAAIRADKRVTISVWETDLEVLNLADCPAAAPSRFKRE